MQTQIFLIAPADAETAAFAAELKTLLETHEVSALLLPRGNRAENAYKDFAKAIVPIGQAGGAAVLLEGAPGLVKMLGADGLHIPDGDIEATREAVAKALRLLREQGLVHTGPKVISVADLEPLRLLGGTGGVPGGGNRASRAPGV